MNHGSLSRLFWGLFLLFFNISIAHLDLLTTSLGVYLLAAALWQLGPGNLPLRRAFRCSLALAVFKAAGLVLACLRREGTIRFTFSGGLTSAGSVEQALWLSLFATAATLAMLYNIFRGLGVLAEQMGDAPLKQRLNRCFYLYLGYTALLYALMLFPALALLAMLAAFIVCVSILVQVSRFGRLADNAESFRERRLGWRFCGIAGGSVMLVLGACLTALILVSAPPVRLAPYIRQDSKSSQAQAYAIRQTLKKGGAAGAVLDDLPDSEILHDQGARLLSVSEESMKMDGGTLRMTEYCTGFPSGRMRLLYVYDWVTLPRHRYCDSFWIDMNPQLITVSPESELNGFALYDRKAASGTATYRAGFLRRLGGVETGSMTPQAEYRLLGGAATRQRGFLAFDTQLPLLKKGMAVELIANYTHQESLFTLEGSAPPENRDGNFTSVMQGNPESSDAYQRFQFMFIVNS